MFLLFHYSACHPCRSHHLRDRASGCCQIRIIRPCSLDEELPISYHRIGKTPCQKKWIRRSAFSWRRSSVVVLVLLWLFSCAGASPIKNSQAIRVIENVSFHPQEAYQCGPASLAGVLNYWGLEASPEEIAAEIYSKSAKGTLNIDMALYAEKRGLKARQYGGSFEDIKSKIDSGYPLIVMVDEGFLVYQKNHFMVVIGYGGEGILANSGAEQRKFIPVKNFSRSWKRTKFWTLWITPK